jgi:hypothetical protein
MYKSEHRPYTNGNPNTHNNSDLKQLMADDRARLADPSILLKVLISFSRIGSTTNEDVPNKVTVNTFAL